MDEVPDASHDLVFYSNGGIAWISDLSVLFASGLHLSKIAGNPVSNPRFQGEAQGDAGATDYKSNQRTGLPVWLTLAARKPRSEGPLREHLDIRRKPCIQR